MSGSRDFEGILIPHGSFEESIERSFVHLEDLLGLTITVHDVAGVFINQDGSPLLKRNRLFHMHPYCRHGREQQFNSIDQLCMRDCRIRANREMRESRAPCVQLCWRGVRQIVIPLERRDTWIGSLFLGPFRALPAPSHLPPATREMHRALPDLDDSQIARIVSVAATFAKGILERVEEHLQESLGPSDRPHIIRRFLRYSAAKKSVTLRHLAAELHLSPSRTSHVVLESFGVSFKRLLIEERLKKGCYLLETTSYPVSQVAELTGFASEYYFSRLFNQKIGRSPTAYRREVMGGIRPTFPSGETLEAPSPSPSESVASMPQRPAGVEFARPFDKVKDPG